MDGIYTAYVTGEDGFSVVLFVLREGKLTGADVGGVVYKGQYMTKADRLEGTINASFPPNSQSITGYEVGSDGETIQFGFTLKFEQIGSGYITLETPHGPVTAAVHRLEVLP